MLTKPIGHFAATDLAGGEIEHKALLGVDGGLDRPHDLERRRSGIPPGFRPLPIVAGQTAASW